DLHANVRIGTSSFVAGTKDLFDFINRRTDEFYTTDQITTLTVDAAASQLQVTYLVNPRRTVVASDNVLNLSGVDMSPLQVSLQDGRTGAGAFILNAIRVAGASIAFISATNDTRSLRLSVPLGISVLTLTPTAYDAATVISVNGQQTLSGSPIAVSAA